jgi:F0F1-type ATP synthase assembly protein I
MVAQRLQLGELLIVAGFLIVYSALVWSSWATVFWLHTILGIGTVLLTTCLVSLSICRHRRERKRKRKGHTQGLDEW